MDLTPTCPKLKYLLIGFLAGAVTIIFLLRASPELRAWILGPTRAPVVAEDCYNGIDDDGDFMVDRQDPDCLLDTSGDETNGGWWGFISPLFFPWGQ
jgi:hypothetical protein